MPSSEIFQYWRYSENKRDRLCYNFYCDFRKTTSCSSLIDMGYLLFGIAMLIVNSYSIYITEKYSGKMNWWAVIGGCFAIALIVMHI